MNKPKISDFKSNYPIIKIKRNYTRLWRWLIIGRLGFFISWIAARLNISANNITVLSFLFGLIGIYFLVQGKFIIGLIGINFWYLFDCADGNLARYYKVKSKLGQFLDEALGEIILTFMWFAIGIGLYKTPDLSIVICEDIKSIHLFFSGSFISVAIALRNCISFRFFSIHEKNKSNDIQNNTIKNPNPIIKIAKFIWNTITSFGGMQAPLLLMVASIDYLGLLVIFYSFLYGFYLFILTIYYIIKLNRLVFK